MGLHGDGYNSRMPNTSHPSSFVHDNYSTTTSGWDRETTTSPMSMIINMTKNAGNIGSMSAMNVSMTENTMMTSGMINDVIAVDTVEIEEIMALDISPTTNLIAATVGELLYSRTVTSIMMTISVAMVNMAMGAAIGKVELMRQWRVPSGVLVGSITQFILFPVAALAIAHLFRLPGPYITGIMLVAICPGGAMANVVCFFADGNISLCTSMVLISTVVSIGYVPILLLIISHGISAGPIALSLWAVGVSVIIIAVPLIIGVIIRSISETCAQVVTVAGIVAGLLVFTANSLVQLIVHSEVFHAPFRVYCATMFLPVAAFLIAMLVACLFSQHPTSRHTLAIQASFHNTSLAILILTTTFSSSPSWRQLVVVPSIYGPISGIFGLIYIIVYLITSCGTEGRSSHDPSATSGYAPIDEAPRGNGDYMALQGKEEVEVEMGNRRGRRLQMNGYEEVNGIVAVSAISDTLY